MWIIIFFIKRYVCFIEYIVFSRSSCCSKLGIVTEIGGGNETGNLVSYGDFLLRDVYLSKNHQGFTDHPVNDKKKNKKNNKNARTAL